MELKSDEQLVWVESIKPKVKINLPDDLIISVIYSAQEGFTVQLCQGNTIYQLQTVCRKSSLITS